MSCSSTDAALSWLLSLSSACSSSPFRSSSPAENFDNFTDWFHDISPSGSSSSPPLQDVSSSNRINLPQEQNANLLHYDYDLYNVFQVSQAVSQSDSVSDSNSVVLPTSILNLDNRILSLDSSSITLVNTPSRNSLSLLSPTINNGEHGRHPISPHYLSPPSLFASPASRLIPDFSQSPFGSCYNHSAFIASFPGHSMMSDISPIDRANKRVGELSNAVAKAKDKATKSKKKKRQIKVPDSRLPLFVERLHSMSTVPSELLDSVIASPESPSALPPPALLSPVKLSTASPVVDIERVASPRLETPSELGYVEMPGPVVPPLAIESELSPLTPLTPCSSPVASPQIPPLKIKIPVKRKVIYASTPVRKSKRPRRQITVDFSSPLRAGEGEGDHNASPSVPDAMPSHDNEAAGAAFTNRTFPNIEISLEFPLFYRRFPASSYYKPPDADSPCSLFNVVHPGGVHNPPRYVFDLYTPRFVKGRGSEKVGLCPICVEPTNRGGENKKLWLAMKFSAFKWQINSSYHMQYAHGISAASGKPFSPPTAFRIVPRPNPGRNEKRQLQQGRCHKCSKWVNIEGVKDVDSKVPELHWWKHAASCHQDSTLAGEGDYFENDDIHARLTSFQPSDA